MQKFDTIGATSNMSRRPVLVLVALSSLFFASGAAQAPSVADLLLRDQVQEAESLLNQQPRTAQTIAFRGEIEFRRGHFDQAQNLYSQALELDAKTERAHFGQGRLALAKLKTDVAIREISKAVELDPQEPLYR